MFENTKSALNVKKGSMIKIGVDTEFGIWDNFIFRIKYIFQIWASQVYYIIIKGWQSAQKIGGFWISNSLQIPCFIDSNLIFLKPDNMKQK